MSSSDKNMTTALITGEVVSAGNSEKHGSLYRSKGAAEFERKLAEYSGCGVKTSGPQPPSNVGENMAVVSDSILAN